MRVCGLGDAPSLSFHPSALPAVDEVLFTLWDHYYIFAFGSIRELTASHTLITEEFCLLYPAVLPERNRDRLFNEFAARV